MMKKTYLTLAFILAVLLIPASSSAYEVGARGYYWFPSLDGEVKVNEANIIGTTIDFDDDLGIEDESFPTIEAFIVADKHHFSLAYTSIDYSGTKTLTKSIVFNGKTYSASALVNSSIEYRQIDLVYQYDFLNLENVLAGFSLGGVIQVKYLDGEVSLKTTGIDEKGELTLPIPMIGFNLHIGLLADILEARIRGTAIGYSGNMIYEIVGDISYTPFPFIDIHGGYKTFTIDIDEDDVFFDYGISGPYIALALSF
jgi:outer membrane protein